MHLRGCAVPHFSNLLTTRQTNQTVCKNGCPLSTYSPHPRSKTITPTPRRPLCRVETFAPLEQSRRFRHPLLHFMCLTRKALLPRDTSPLFLTFGPASPLPICPVPPIDSFCFRSPRPNPLLTQGNSECELAVFFPPVPISKCFYVRTATQFRRFEGPFFSSEAYPVLPNYASPSRSTLPFPFPPLRLISSDNFFVPHSPPLFA